MKTLILKASLTVIVLFLAACASTPSDNNEPVEVPETKVNTPKPQVEVIEKSTVVSSNPLPRKKGRLKKEPLKTVEKQSASTKSTSKYTKPGQQSSVSQGGTKKSSRNLESPIIRKMLRQADMAARNRQWSKAENYLERALRVDSKNAIVWQKLAEVKLAQDRPNQAIQFARKSIALASGNSRITKQGWSIVEESNRRLNRPSKTRSQRR